MSLREKILDEDLNVVTLLRMSSQRSSEPAASFRFPAHVPRPLGLFSAFLETLKNRRNQLLKEIKRRIDFYFRLCLLPYIVYKQVSWRKMESVADPGFSTEGIPTPEWHANLLFGMNLPKSTHPEIRHYECLT